jgi:glycosyltransferase involved in cell wall biosynthesis
MSDKPLVSVLVTSYNRSEYICETIDSILNQTYPNFEIIICDNCSTDNTMNVIKKYADNPRVRIYQNKENIGQFPNRNKIAGYAKGKYIKYVDSDDLIYPHGLEIIVEGMEQFPEAGYGLSSIEQDFERIFPFMLSPEQSYERHFCKKIPLFHKAPLSSIIKKEIFFEVGGFTNNHGEGDYEMWLVLSRKKNVVLMPHGIVWYREHENQIYQEIKKDPFKTFRYFLVTKKYLSEDCPLDPAKAKKALAENELVMVKYILRTLFTESSSKALEMYRAAGFGFFDFIKKSLRVILKIAIK